MAKAPTRDLHIMIAVWTVMATTNRPFWAPETLAHVRASLEKGLQGRYTETGLTSLLEAAREVAANDLGLPPWNQ
jgi:hypothetical protein